MSISIVNGHVWLLSFSLSVLMLGGGIYFIVLAIKTWKDIMLAYKTWKGDTECSTKNRC